MKIKPQELEENGYELAEKLRHNELLVFLNKKNKEKKSVYIYSYIISVFLPIGLISYTLSYEFFSGGISIAYGLIYCLLGILLVFLFIPFHELLHALAYRIVGAKKISFYSNFKKMYFAVVADKSVVNVNEFKIVALTPFLAIIVASFFLFFKINTCYTLTILSFLATHNLFCGGDFLLLNYMEINKNKAIVTFDDKEKGETYFYIKKRT